MTSDATLRPSAAYTFKSSIAIEDEYADAHIKVDFDTHRNPIDVKRIAFAIANATHFRGLTGVKMALTVARLAFQGLEHPSTLSALIFTTGRGHHLRLWYYTSTGIIPAATILRIQAACGDDPVRQKFNTARVKRGEAHWNVLWRAKYRNGVQISKEVFDPQLTDNLNAMLEGIAGQRKRREAGKREKVKR